MEEGYLKSEPVDAIDFNVNAEPLTIINPDASNDTNDSCKESKHTLEESDPIQNQNDDDDTKYKRKQLRKASTVKSEKVDKKSRVRKSASERKPKSYVCDECGKEFKKAYGLSRHKLLHSGIKPYVCPEENCGAAFSQNSALKSHQMTHTGERKYFCEECGHGFLSKFQMEIHQRSKHSGERPFICTKCGEGFVRQLSLTRHLLKHSEKLFECDECDMRFYERRLLTSHKKIHSSGGSPFTCAECGKGFYHKTGLNAHKRNHLTFRPFGCEICGKRFIQKGTLNVHKAIHGVRPFGCEVCGLRFTQKFTLKTHRMKQHGLSTDLLKQPKTGQHIALSVVTEVEPKIVSHNDNILPSSYDNVRPSESNGTRKFTFPLNIKDFNELEERTSATESGFGAAQQVEETSESRKSSPFSFKKEASSSESDFNDDEPTGFEQKFLVDTVAGIATTFDQIKEESTVTCEPLLDIWKSEPVTSDDDYLSDSEKPKKNQAAFTNSADESAERPFSCGKCERKFALIGALKNHQRSHSQTNKVKPPVVCDVCGKIFREKEYLKIHKRIHSGSKPYTCKECDKSFTFLSTLKGHQMIHTGERLFACDSCGSTFGRKASLELHMRRHADIRDFECDVCGRKFVTSSSLKRHNLSHTKERNYGCDICGKKFIDKSYVKFHLRTHTGYKPCVCDQCPSSFINTSDLKRHKRHRHRAIGEPSPYQQQKLKKMMKSRQ